MKKFEIFIIILFLPSISVAHMAHYNKFNKIEMEIFRNDKLIGFSKFFFSRKGDKTVITNHTKFSVKILGANIFKVEGYSEEIYIKEMLISYNSETLQNNKKKYVKLNFDKDKNKFIIKGSSYNGEASIENIIGHWWNHKILQATSQISPVSGSIKEQIVTFINREKFTQYNQVFEVEHFTLKSKNINLPEDKKLDFNVWYDPKNAIIIRISYSRMGNWEYRLKTVE